MVIKKLFTALIFVLMEKKSSVDFHLSMIERCVSTNNWAIDIHSDSFYSIVPSFLGLIDDFVISFSLFTVDNADMLLEKSQKMIERFNYPWEMMPLLYVILKYANGDLEEATNQLSEGNRKQNVNVTYKLPDIAMSHIKWYVAHWSTKCYYRFDHHFLFSIAFQFKMNSFRFFFRFCDLQQWNQNIINENFYSICLGQDFIGKYSRMQNLNIFDGGERGSTRQCGW